MDQARLSASLILLRPRACGSYEVLLMQRKQGMVFSEAHVFPGGKWETSDSLEVWEPLLGLTRPETLSSTPLTAEIELNSLKITAIRETFEESGIYIGSGALGPPVSGDFYQLCREKRALPDLGRLRYFVRMITPQNTLRRFDTVFFIAAVPQGTEFTLTEESQSAQWLSPAELLDRAAELQLLPPQCLATLLLAHYPLFSDLMQANPLPTTVFPLMSAIIHPENPKWVVIVAYGDEEYPVSAFLPEIKGKRLRIWMEPNGIHFEISPGLVPYMDRAQYRLVRDFNKRLQIVPKTRL